MRRYIPDELFTQGKIPMTTFFELMRSMSEFSKINPEEAAAKGGITIIGDDGLEVVLEAGPEGETLHLHSTLCAVPDAAAATVYPKLMTLHLFGYLTEGAGFGLDAGSGRLVLFRTLLLKNLSPVELPAIVNAFAGQARYWHAELPALCVGNQPSAAKEAAKSSVTPVNMV